MKGELGPEEREPPARKPAGPDAARSMGALKPSIADQIYASIRKDLMECRWPAGHTLKIRNLAAEFGVSPMPVRMALKRLGEEGVLDVEENRSARVPTISQQRFSEFLEITVVLETLAVQRALSRISKEQIKALVDRAEAIRKDLEAGLTSGYAQRFNAILMDLYRIGGSTALIEMIEYTWVKVAPASNTVFETPVFVSRIHVHLHEILKAIQRQDAHAAQAALTAALSYADRAMNLLLDMDRLPRATATPRTRRPRQHQESKRPANT